MIKLLRQLILVFVLFVGNLTFGQKLQMVVPKGHTSNIKMAIYNPKLPLIATASNDKSIKLWDENSGKLICSLLGHSGTVNYIVFSPNGKLLAAASDSTVYLWNIINGQLISKISTKLKQNSVIYFSSDNQQLIYQDSPKSFTVRNIKTSKLDFHIICPNKLISSTTFDFAQKVLFYSNSEGIVYRFDIQNDTISKIVYSLNQKIINLTNFNNLVCAITLNGEIYCWNQESLLINKQNLGFIPVKISNNPNSKIIAIVDSINRITVFDIEQHKITTTFESKLPKIEFITLGNRNSFIVASCIENIKVWDSTGLVIGQYSDHTKDVDFIKFNSDDSKFLSCGRDIYALEWNFSKKPIQVFSGYTRNISSVDYSINNQHFATTSNDSAVKIWSNRNGKVVASFNGNQSGLDYLNIAPIHNYLLSSGNSYFGQIWNFTTGDSVTTLKGHKWKITDSEFSNNEEYLLTSSLDETIKLWKIPEGRLVHSFESKKWVIESVSFNSIATQLVSTSSDNRIRIWNCSDGKLLKKLRNFKKRWSDVQFLSGMDTLIALSQTGKLYLIDVRKNSIIDTLNRGSEEVISMIVSKNKKIIYAVDNESIKIWDVDNKQVKATLPIINGINTTIQLNNNETKLISNSRNTRISNDYYCSLWDLTNNTLIANINSHTQPVKMVKFSPDNKFIITISNDHTLKLWSAETGKELLSMLVMSHNNWLITTPEGLFDASPGAMQLIHFVVNTPNDSLQPWKIIELEQLKHRYYQPLLWAIVTGNSMEQLRVVPAIDSIEPPPTFSVKTEQDSLIINIESDLSQVGKTSIFIDDIEIIEDVKELFPIKNKQIAIPLILFENLLNLDSANTIKVIAYNREGYLSSKPETCLYSYQPIEKGTGVRKRRPVNVKKASLFAIVIGTSDYAGTNIDLKYAAYDAYEFAHALEISATCLFGANQTKVFLLTTDNIPKTGIPTKDTIQKYIEFIAQKARPEDIVVVYFSGHGVNYGGQDGDFYYITKDASSATQAYLNDPFVRNHYAISSSELTTWMNKISARKKVLIFDACASGKAAEVMLANVKEVPSSQIRAFERMKDRTGFYILAGSASDAVSYETSIYGQGLLTYSLLKAMKGAYLRRDGAEEYVDVAMLLQYAVEEVPRLAKGIGGIQQPLYRSPSEQRSFDIGCMNNDTKNQICIAEPKPIFCMSTFIDEKFKRDALKLSELINNIMREESVKSKLSPYLFTDGIGYPNAYIISGTYSTSEQIIKVDFVISQNDQVICEPISLTAQKSEINLLIKSIIKQAISTINKSK